MFIMKNLITILSLILLFSSCEQIVELDIEEYEPKIRTSTIIHNIDDNNPQLHSCVSSITNAIGIYDNNSELEFLYGAQVYLSENEIDFTNFSYDLTSNNVLFDMNGEANRYSLVIEYPEYKTVYSELVYPLAPNASNIEYQFENRYSSIQGVYYDEINFTINDNEPEKTNYYGVQVMIETKCCGDRYPIWTFANDFNLIKLNGFGSVIAFSDNLGEQFKIQVENTWIDLDEHKVILKVSQFTEDYYRFLVSYNNYINSADNPFAEPITIYSNIENGLGIFGAMNSKWFIATE